MSDLEETFAAYWRLFAPGAPAPAREYRFAPPRRWRADFAWPAHRVMVEIEGGTHSNGRHVRGYGYASDIEKYNAATLAGWRILRYTGDMLAADPLKAVGEVLALLVAPPPAGDPPCPDRA